MEHLSAKAEAWYNQSQITYKNIYLQAKNTDTGELEEFNSPVFVEGKRGYQNKIDAMPRSRVIVTLSKSSPSEQYAKRGMLYDMTKIYSAHPDLFKPQIHTVTNQMIDTLELSPEERIQHQMVSHLQRQNDILALISEGVNLSAGTMNAQVMIAQAQQMLQKMGGGNLGVKPQGQGQNQVSLEEEAGAAGAVEPESPMGQTAEEQYVATPESQIGAGEQV
jgi:hypothetical protein